MKKMILGFVAFLSLSTAFAQDAGLGKGARERLWSTAERAAVAVIKAAIDDDRVKVKVVEGQSEEVARTAQSTVVNVEVVTLWNKEDQTHVTYQVEVDKAGLVREMKVKNVQY